MTGWTLGAIVYFSGPIFSAGYLARPQPVETPLYGQIASAGNLMCSPGWESVSFPCGEFTPRFGLHRPSRGMSDAQVVDLLWEMNRPAVKLLLLISAAQWRWNRWLLWPTFRTVSYSWKRDDNCRSHTLAYVKDQIDLVEVLPELRQAAEARLGLGRNSMTNTESLWIRKFRAVVKSKPQSLELAVRYGHIAVLKTGAWDAYFAAHGDHDNVPDLGIIETRGAGIYPNGESI